MVTAAFVRRVASICRIAFVRCAATLLAFAAPVILAGPGELSAQDVRVTATADTNTLRVGEQVRVTVSVEHPGGYLLRNIGPANSPEGLEIVGVDSAAPASGAGGPSVRRVYTFTAFDTGTYVVPAFVVYYSAPSDTALRSATGAPIALFV
ncbi:MAG TPA: BatD family protein, partial [Bacteroidota bacterium]|nr:BatD family protein [Bacteroidota bacterium]